MVVWNLFLALVPCVAVWFCRKAAGWKFWTLALIWLFFLPNAPYLFTLVRHLVDYCSDYDALNRVCVTGSGPVFFFFGYAFLGVPLFYYALGAMTREVGRRFGAGWGRWFPVGIMPIVALGTLFGLVDRLNSWQIVTAPWVVLRVAFGYVLEAGLFYQWAGLTALLYLVYYSLKALHDPRTA